MTGKSKNFLIFFKKPQFYLVLFLLIFGLVLPFGLAKAQGLVSWVAEGLAEFLVNYILAVVIWLSNVVLQLVIIVLNYVLTPNFITWSYTDPARNEIIKIGWGLTRNLANVFLLFVFIWIAISIALGRRDYEAKKLLPKLILIALLINFTPVICGVIVDFSNILMNFFLGQFSGWEFMANKIESESHALRDTISAQGSGPIFGIIEAVIQTVLILYLNIFISLIILAYIFLFIMRYIAIWMLVILSPLAFVAWIIPDTSSNFSTWWNNFFQWCIIGIPATFFLYLTNVILANTGNIASGVPSVSDWFGITLANLIQTVMPFFVATGFGLVGFWFSIKSAAAGASMVTGALSTVGKAISPEAAVTGLATAGLKGAAQLQAGALGLPARALGAATKPVREGIAGAAGGVAGGLISRMERIPGLSWMTGGAGAYQAKKTAEDKRKIDEIKQAIGNYTPEALAQNFRSPFTSRYEKAAAFETLAAKEELRTLKTEEMEKYIPDFRKVHGDEKLILAQRPDLAGAFGMSPKEVFSKITPQKIGENIQVEAFKSPDVLKAIVESLDVVRSILRSRTRPFGLKDELVEKLIPLLPEPPSPPPPPSPILLPKGAKISRPAPPPPSLGVTVSPKVIEELQRYGRPL